MLAKGKNFAVGGTGF